MITVSIVSHGHGIMVQRLVEQVLTCSEVGRVIVTYNIPECYPPFSDSRIVVINNSRPKGFGANHNVAFLRSQESLWCVLNPDIELEINPFPALIEKLRTDSVGLVAPLIINSEGKAEDSIRHFPTLASLVLKLLGRDNSRYEVISGSPEVYPDWVAGMFHLYRSEVFAELNGFDEGFFLYYEDVDICARLWEKGMKILACPSVSIVHDARRDSHRSAKHLRFHLASMARYFLKHWRCIYNVDAKASGKIAKFRNKAE